MKCDSSHIAAPSWVAIFSDSILNVGKKLMTNSDLWGPIAAISSLAAVGSPILKHISTLLHRKPEACQTNGKYSDPDLSDVGLYRMVYFQGFALILIRFPVASALQQSFRRHRRVEDFRWCRVIQAFTRLSGFNDISTLPLQFVSIELWSRWTFRLAFCMKAISVFTGQFPFAVSLRFRGLASQPRLHLVVVLGGNLLGGSSMTLEYAS